FAVRPWPRPITWGLRRCKSNSVGSGLFKRGPGQDSDLCVRQTAPMGSTRRATNQGPHTIAQVPGQALEGDLPEVKCSAVARGLRLAPDSGPACAADSRGLAREDTARGQAESEAPERQGVREMEELLRCSSRPVF